MNFGALVVLSLIIEFALTIMIEKKIEGKDTKKKGRRGMKL